MASLVHQSQVEKEPEVDQDATQENFGEPIPAAPTFAAPVLSTTTDAGSAPVPSVTMPSLAAPAPTAAEVIASTMPEVAKAEILNVLTADELQGRIRMIESQMQPQVAVQEKSFYKEAEESRGPRLADGAGLIAYFLV